MSKELKKPKKEESEHSKHRQRMREKFKRGGLDVFADHEVIEILLYMGIPRKNTNKLAHKILKEFGSLHALFEADYRDIMRRTGLTENTAVIFAMIPGLIRRYRYSKDEKRMTFQNTEQMGKYATIPFEGKTHECFYMYCFNKRFQLNGMEMIDEGTLDTVQLHMRKIVNVALMNNSAYVVLSHNHPSGCLEISNADLSATRDIMHLLSKFNIEVLDHIIVAGNKYTSFLEQKKVYPDKEELKSMNLKGIRDKK